MIKNFIKSTLYRYPKSSFMMDLVVDKYGLEIGGPSDIFKTKLPIYNVIGGLDGLNFSHNNLWSHENTDPTIFSWGKGKFGKKFIAEAADLRGISDSSYDFLLSSNCLEHVANPLAALREWKRVIKQGGFIFLLLPNKFSNFDHRRPFTTFEHLLDDLNASVDEGDLTHLSEILSLHDLKKDPLAGSLSDFSQRSLDNFSNRALHHHVFDLPLVCQSLEHFNFQILLTYKSNLDIFVLGKK